MSSKIPVQLAGAIPFHKKGITGKNVTIAVLDSGLSPHPDFDKERILAFEDFLFHKKMPYDDFSHGTHVTGILASSRIGIAPESKIISLKILDRSGHGSSPAFLDATEWILQQKDRFQIRIVNISIGATPATPKNVQDQINAAVKQLWNAGLVVCCSAGNNGPKPDSGSCRQVITVGASDGRRFSSAGPLLPYITKPELVAPGYRIISTSPYRGYSLKNGTSMSVPFISGACALLLQLNPDLTNDQIKLRLMDSAFPVPFLPFNLQGAGIVDLTKLLR